MLTPQYLRSWFDKALSFESYLATARPDQMAQWTSIHSRIVLTPPQKSLLAAFQRDMPVLVLSGHWCGDCAQQVPIFDHIAKVSPRINLRIIDRDVAIELSDQVKICGGNRVPTVLFMNEDFDFISIYGDNTLSRVRAKAAKYLGPACPLPGAPLPTDELATSISDWINEFERSQLICRLSSKLRARHQD